MPTANRRRWMRDYMKEYRQGKLRGDVAGRHSHSTKREDLKMAHRFESFKWRVSKLLGAQYEILLCVQYDPEKWTDKGMVRIWTDVDEDNATEFFPALEEFQYQCKPGGEIFKVFVVMKFNRRQDEFTSCVVGVLDKLALLKNLQKLPDHDRKEWNSIIKKIEIEARSEIWHELDFSEDTHLWLENDIWCSPLRWTFRNRPSWRSARLRKLLLRWKVGSRRIGKWDRFEIRGANNALRRGIFSPLLSDD
jgi:hypothetical protein